MVQLDWKTKGKLSVVSQGGIFLKNIVEVTNYSLEWRKLFPNAEIILSISSSDFINFSSSTENIIEYHAAFSNNNTVRNCCNLLNKCIDKFSYCKSSIVLPPVKINNPNCNANFQIEAAKLGLEKATGEYVLRIRNDILFLNDSFIEDYESMNKVKRGRFSLFSERVMISPLFTLNPYALERLPFHFSDWFHFGRIDDVKRIWDVPLISFGDMIYYKNHHHAASSNSQERRFFARLAVEQYLVYNCFKKTFPDIELKYHNDTSSIRESILILIDNFCIIDIENGNVYFPKYENDFHYAPNKNICITNNSWNKLCKNREEDPEEILSFDKKQIGEHNIEDYPYLFSSNKLKTKNGFHNGGDIILNHNGTDGVLVYGPHCNIQEGRYLANIYLTSLKSPSGRLIIKATLEHGKEELSKKVINLKNYNNDFIKDSDQLKLTIYFYCGHKVGRDFEIVIETIGIEDTSIRGVEIDRCSLKGAQEAEINSEVTMEKKIILPPIESFSIQFRMNLFLIKLLMKSKMKKKLENNPVEFFRDSKHFAVKKMKNTYEKKLLSMNE